MRTECALMVMPRSRSRSIASSTCACISRAVRTGELQQAVGKRALPMVDMGDDREISDECWIHGAAAGASTILQGKADRKPSTRSSLSKRFCSVRRRVRCRPARARDSWSAPAAGLDVAEAHLQRFPSCKRTHRAYIARHRADDLCDGRRYWPMVRMSTSRVGEVRKTSSSSSVLLAEPDHDAGLGGSAGLSSLARSSRRSVRS